MTVEYRFYAADQCVGYYHAQLSELANIAKRANAVPYLYEPDDAFFQCSLGQEHIKVFAFSDGQLVGFSFLRILYQWPDYFDFLSQPSELSALVLMNLVHPQYRGRGIGRQMLLRRIEGARQMGVKHLYTTVHPHNEHNVKLLTSIGMKTIVEREVFTIKALRKVMYMSL